MISRVTTPAVTPKRYDAGGFTLLELLVALAVLGFLLVALNNGVKTGLGIWDVQSRQVNKIWDLDATARLFRTLLTRIPASPIASINPGSPAVALAFSGKADELSFVGYLPTGLGTDRPADITLQLLGKRLVLKWQPHHHELAGSPQRPTVSEVVRGIDRLEFAYWGPPTPTASTSAWLAAWDGPSLPDLVRIRMGFDQNDPRRWPDLVVAPRF